MTGPITRLALLASILAVPIGAGLIACTAGDELTYPGAPGSGADGGMDGALDSGRIVGDSMVDATPVARPDDGGIFPAIKPLPCAGLGDECDPTAGMGCCLPSAGGSNACFEQLQHFGGTSCTAPGDVYLACLTSTGDSTCCWQTEPGGASNTRYREACTGGVEACDPSADGGGVCSSGAACNSVTCKGVVVGYCGGGPAPCQP